MQEGRSRKPLGYAVGLASALSGKKGGVRSQVQGSGHGGVVKFAIVKKPCRDVVLLEAKHNIILRAWGETDLSLNPATLPSQMCEVA